MPYSLIYGEMVLRSVANATKADAQALLKMASEAQVRTEVEVYSLDDANEALRKLRGGGRIRGAAVPEIA